MKTSKLKFLSAIHFSMAALVALLMANSYNSNATNLAIGKTATASIYTSLAPNANDGNLSTSWTGSGGVNANIVIDLAGTYTVREISLNMSLITGFTLEYYNGTGYTLFYTGSPFSGWGTSSVVPSFTPQTCSRIRFTITSIQQGPNVFVLNEIGIFDEVTTILPNLNVAGNSIFSGNVLINKTSQVNTTYKLDVAGPVRADAITVNTTGADFVFDENYKLKPLSEVESFVKVNKHLLGIAPACEMQANGANIGELQTQLLQKVEELTLYLIELKKENESIKKLNGDLNKRVFKLEND